MDIIKDVPKSVYDTVIIGAGPAGLSAAIYASRARLKTVVLEDPSVISQAAMADYIENYPGFSKGANGIELIKLCKEQAQNSGAELKGHSVKAISAYKRDGMDIWEVGVENEVYSALSVIVASGARTRELGVSGEKKLLGRGVSYCATCDGPFFKNKIIAVVGGGNTAVEEALFLTRFAGRVLLIHRRDKLRATKSLQEKLLANEKIEVMWSSVVDRVIGEDRLKAVIINNLKDNMQNEIPCDGLFISIGHTPNTDFIKGLVDIDDKGYIKTDDKMQASKKGIFACGDCRNTHLRQIITACGDGALAATACQLYIDELKGTSYE